MVWIVVEIKTLGAYPFEGVLTILLVLNSCGLKGLYFFDDTKRLEDIGDIIEPPGLRLKVDVVIPLVGMFRIALCEELDSVFNRQNI